MYESKFKQYQRENRIPTEDLADILGVSKSMVYYWRKFGVGRWTKARQIAQKLGCQVEDIIGTVKNDY